MAAPATGQLKREADDARDLAAAVGDGVVGALRVALATPAVSAVVGAGGKLADDDEVGAAGDLGPQRSAAGEGGEGADGAEIDAEAQALAQPVDGCSRSRVAAQMVPARGPGSAEEDGVGLAAELQGRLGEGASLGLDGGSGDRPLGQLEVEVVGGGGAFEDAHRAGDDLRADAVAGKDDDTDRVRLRLDAHGTPADLLVNCSGQTKRAPSLWGSPLPRRRERLAARASTSYRRIWPLRGLCVRRAVSRRARCASSGNYTG